MTFPALLDERERKALAALTTAAPEERTTDVREFHGSDPQANSTTALFILPMHSPSSGSWVPTDPSRWWQSMHHERTISDVRSPAYLAGRYRALHTSLHPDVLYGEVIGRLVTATVGLGAAGSAIVGALHSLCDWKRAEEFHPQNLQHHVASTPAQERTAPAAWTVRGSAPKPSSASPKARVGTQGRGSMTPLADWFKKNKEAFAGRWVALDEKGQFLDADVSRAALRRRLLAAGQLRGVVLTQVPDTSE